MGLSSSHAGHRYLGIRMVCLAALMLCLSVAPVSHSTAKAQAAPAAQPFTAASACQTAASLGRPELHSVTAADNPLATSFINAVPSSDGSDVFVSVAGVRVPGSKLVLAVDPGIGPTGHEGSYAMAISGTSYLATAIGFAPQEDIGIEGDDTMSVTTTIGSDVLSTGPITSSAPISSRHRLSRSLSITAISRSICPISAACPETPMCW